MIGSKKSLISTIKFNDEKLDTIVSSNITIEGVFKSTGNIRLDCTIFGEVNSESLFIGENSYIKGTVNCENIVVAGKIEGNVFCNGKMHIKETGVIDGDIVVNVLSMDEGSLFTGNCTIKKSVVKLAENDNKNRDMKDYKEKTEKSDNKSFVNKEHNKEKSK